MLYYTMLIKTHYFILNRIKTFKVNHIKIDIKY